METLGGFLAPSLESEGKGGFTLGGMHRGFHIFGIHGLLYTYVSQLRIYDDELWGQETVLGIFVLGLCQDRDFSGCNHV